MPRIGNYTEEETRIVLEQYILPKECAADPFTTDLRPEWVSTFVRDSVKKDLIGRPMRRATDVVRFYALRDRTDQLAGFFTGNEKTQNDLERACFLIVTLCELGTPDRQNAAVKEFERLLAAPVAVDGLETLINTFFSLPPKVASTAITKRVSDLRAECERKGPEEKLGHYMEYDIRLLPWVISAKTRKDSILSLPAGPPRLQRWAEAYLAYETTTPFAWDRHAGFALAQDGRAAGDPATVKAITAAMAKIDPKKDDAEITKFRKTRGYRAREFFLETLTEEEKDDEKDFQRVQEDLVV
jgi:hypothetical protein